MYQNSWWNKWGFIVALVLVIVAVMVLAVLLGLYYIDRPICLRTAQAIELEARWGFWASCLVKVNDRWIPYSRWTAVEYTPLD